MPTSVLAGAIFFAGLFWIAVRLGGATGGALIGTAIVLGVIGSTVGAATYNLREREAALSALSGASPANRHKALWWVSLCAGALGGAAIRAEGFVAGFNRLSPGLRISGGKDVLIVGAILGAALGLIVPTLRLIGGFLRLPTQFPR